MLVTFHVGCLRIYLTLILYPSNFDGRQLLPITARKLKAIRTTTKSYVYGSSPSMAMGSSTAR